MEVMRVALDTGPLHGHQTGVGRAVSNLSDALGSRNDIQLQPFVLSFRARVDGNETRLPLPARLATRLWARWPWPRADRWLHNVDLVHGTNYIAPPTSLPTVISMYDCWFLEHPASAHPDVRRAGEILRRSVAAGAWVHTSSNATTRKATALLGTDRVRTVHLGPGAATVPPSQTPEICLPFADSPFIVAIGTTEHRKRHPWLTQLVPKLNAGVSLVIAGATGNDTPHLHIAIDSLPLGDKERIHTLGPVDSGTKAWLLAHARAMAYPSLDEGFGFPILEAQHAGLPIVASDVGSIGEVGGDGVSLVDVDDADGFAAALNALIDHSDDRERHIARGRSNVERFSWQRCADEMVELYREVVASS
jgi:glycosyltransferase involved in cell wall biosynthesis